MNRVLILSASAGAGHLRAAEAVERALREETPNVEVRNLDVLELATGAFREAYSKWYLQLVQRAPALYGYLYDRLDRPPRHKPVSLRHALEHWNTRKLRRFVREFDPDAIVCTHFLPVEALVEDRREGKLRSPLGVVVTDSDVHRLWVHRGVDQYFVARDEAAVVMEALGFGQAVEVSGIPIDPRFALPADRARLRAKHRLPEGPVVLLLGGGFGVGPIVGMAERLSAARQPALVVAVAGRNDALRRQLEALGHPRLRALGFTTEMDEWMAAADLLVTKPGGLTTSEALARRLPMVLVNPIPGQEQRNADHLLESGAAVRATTPEVLAWKVDRLLADPARLEALRQGAASIARPHAARQVARWALGLSE